MYRGWCANMGSVDEASVLAAITVGKGGIYLNVHAQPGARKPQLRGMHADAVKIAVHAAAQDGKANAAIVDFIADMLGCAKRNIEVVFGHTSRRKRLFIHGDTQSIMNRLHEILKDV